MKAKKTIRVIITAVVIIGAMAAAFALGASGKFSMVNPHDRLVGVLITTQPWPNGEDRVYAEYIDGEYVFNGVDGIACFASMDDNTLCPHVDDAMTDASVGLHSVNDDAEEVTINATLYLSSSSACIVQRNPVYQTASGDVYAVAGDGAEYRGEGLRGNFSLSDSVKRYEGGKTMTYGTHINIEVEVIAEPENIEVSQFGLDGKMLSREYYAPGALPDSIDSDAAYIVVGTVSQSGTSYELFQSGSDNDITALYCREDGVCVQQSCAVNRSAEK